MNSFVKLVHIDSQVGNIHFLNFFLYLRHKLDFLAGFFHPRSKTLSFALKEPKIRKFLFEIFTPTHPEIFTAKFLMILKKIPSPETQQSFHRGQILFVCLYFQYLKIIGKVRPTDLSEEFLISHFEVFRHKNDVFSLHFQSPFRNKVNLSGDFVIALKMKLAEEWRNFQESFTHDFKEAFFSKLILRDENAFQENESEKTNDFNVVERG